MTRANGLEDLLELMRVGLYMLGASLPRQIQSSQMLSTDHPQVRQLGVMGVLWRGTVVGVAYALFVMIGGAIANRAGLPASSLGTRADAKEMLLGMFLSGALIGITLGPLAVRLPLPAGQRMGLLFAAIYGIGSVINGIEGYFFSTARPLEQVHTLLSTAIGDAGLAVLLTILFPPREIGLRLGTALREATAERPWALTLWRFGLAGLLYLPTFWICGLLVLPHVQAYYQDPSLGLVVPSFQVILLVELARGLLFVATVYPVIAILRRRLNRLGQGFWVAMTIAVLGAWAPMLTASFLPAAMRLYHGIEITGGSIVHSAIIVWLLGLSAGEKSTPRERDVSFIEDEYDWSSPQ